MIHACNFIPLKSLWFWNKYSIVLPKVYYTHHHRDCHLIDGHIVLMHSSGSHPNKRILPFMCPPQLSCHPLVPNYHHTIRTAHNYIVTKNYSSHKLPKLKELCKGSAANLINAYMEQLTFNLCCKVANCL